MNSNKKDAPSTPAESHKECPRVRVDDKKIRQLNSDVVRCIDGDGQCLVKPQLNSEMAMLVPTRAQANMAVRIDSLS